MLKSLVIRKIIQIGNKKLSESSIPIPEKEIDSKENLQLYQDLIDTCNKEKEGTAGLSAVQLGVLKRVYVIRRLDLQEEDDADPLWEVVINPEIEITSDKKSIVWEGCMSVGEGDARLFGPVSRPDAIKLTYTKPSKDNVILELKGYMAHVAQHEQDHLNGVLFLKYVKNPINLWPSKKLDEYLDRYDHFPPSE